MRATIVSTESDARAFDIVQPPRDAPLLPFELPHIKFPGLQPEWRKDVDDPYAITAGNFVISRAITDEFDDPLDVFSDVVGRLGVCIDIDLAPVETTLRRLGCLSMIGLCEEIRVHCAERLDGVFAPTLISFVVFKASASDWPYEDYQFHIAAGPDCDRLAKEAHVVATTPEIEIYVTSLSPVADMKNYREMAYVYAVGWRSCISRHACFGSPLIFRFYGPFHNLQCQLDIIEKFGFSRTCYVVSKHDHNIIGLRYNQSVWCVGARYRRPYQWELLYQFVIGVSELCLNPYWLAAIVHYHPLFSRWDLCELFLALDRICARVCAVYAKRALPRSKRTAENDVELVFGKQKRRLLTTGDEMNEF